MSTISIRNSIEPAMDPLIESRIYVTLGSSLASVRVLEAVIESGTSSDLSGKVVRCDLRALEQHGKWHLVSSQQYDLTNALEGALTRLKRSLLRQRKHRNLGSP
ncbi:MAG: hypothetical protein R3F50_09615 [Gammaproteobacteria bacterium]|jgi:hypothetical protein